MLQLTSTLPWLVPGLAVAFVASIIGSGPVGRILGAHRATAWLLLLSLGVILAGTLSPQRGGLSPEVARTCDFSRTWLATPADLLAWNDVLINVLLFVPLGFAAGALPSSGRKLAVVGGVLALPFVIEALQLVAVALARGCQSADVVDNLTGLVIGLVAGIAVGRVRRGRSTSTGITGSRPG